MAYMLCKSSKSIQLLSDSIISNVAFGITPDKWMNIKFGTLWLQLNWEIVSELPYGLYTPIGDNGISLSGGQRQRLAWLELF